MTRRMWLTAGVAAGVMASAAAAQAAAPYEQGPGANRKPRIAVDFTRWDRNGDGAIDRAEFQQSMKRLGQLLDQRRDQRGPEARRDPQGRQGWPGPMAQLGPRGREGPDGMRGGPRGPQARQGQGPGPEMAKRIQAIVRRTVKETLRQMHQANGPPHGGEGALDGFGPGGPMHGPKGGAMGCPQHGAMGQGMQRGPGHGGFGGGRGMGPMHDGPPMGACPACGCQCGGMGGPKGAMRDGPRQGRGGEGRGQFQQRGPKDGEDRGEYRKPGKKGHRGAGPAACERGPRGEGPQAGPRGPRGDGPPPRLMEMFKRQDANGDGVVTADEFMGPPDRFQKLDVNGDGAVDRKELRQAMKRGQKARGDSAGRGGQERRGRQPRDDDD